MNEATTNFLAIGVLLSIGVYAWLMQRVRRRLRERHPGAWGNLDDSVLPLRRRLVNGASLFGFVLLGRYRQLDDRYLLRVAAGARLLLLVFLIGGTMIAFCR